MAATAHAAPLFASAARRAALDALSWLILAVAAPFWGFDMHHRVPSTTAGFGIARSGLIAQIVRPRWPRYLLLIRYDAGWNVGRASGAVLPIPVLA